MPSKWSEFRAKLPQFEAEPTFQQNVDEAKMLILGTLEGESANINRLAALFAQRKREKDVHEEAISNLNVDLEALSQLLVDALEGGNIESVKLSSGPTGYLGDRLFVSVADKKKFMEWIKQNKMEDMLTINSNTLNGLVGDMVLEMLKGGKKPPSCFKWSLKTQFRLVNFKNGEES